MTNESLVCASDFTPNGFFGLTQYHPIVGTTDTNSSGTELNKEVSIRSAGTIKNMYVRAPTNAITAGSTVFTFRRGTTDSGITVTFAASAIGIQEDTTHTQAITAGDKCKTKVVLPSSANVAITTSIVNYQFDSTTDTVSILGSNKGATSFATASATRFVILQGNWTDQSTEAGTKFRIRKAGSLKYLGVAVGSNSRTTNTIFTSRKNGADGAVTVTFGSSVNGWQEDTTHSDTLAIGDDANIQFMTSTGTGNITSCTIKAEFVSTAGNSIVMSGVNTVITQSEPVTSYYCVGGKLTAQSTEANAKTKSRFAYTVSELNCLIPVNGVIATSTLTFRDSGVAGNNTVSIGSTAVGLFNDTTHTDTLTSTDDMNYQLITGSSAGTVTMSIAWISAMLSTVTSTNYDRPLTAETISVSESLAEIYNANRAPTAETITIGESQVRAFVGVRVMSAETSTIGESMTRLKAANRTQTAETVTIGESLARLLAVIRAPSAETIAVSEAIAKVQVLVRALSDTTTISESLTKILTLVRNIPAETITIGESLARVFVGTRALTTETIPISESLARLKAATRALSDTTAISESLARVFGVVRSLSDTTIIGESLTRVLAAIRALAAQTTTIGESLAKVQVLVRSLADTTIISETLNRLLAAIRALSTETSAIGESLTKVFTPVSGVTAHRPLAAETIAVSESLSRVTTNVRTLIETTIISEALTRLFNGVRVLAAQTTAISESLVSVKTLVRTLSQTTAISESLTKVVVLVRSLTETTVISETLTRLQVLRRALSTEIITISESLAAGKVLLKILSETIPISESLTKFAERIRTLLDSVIIDESLSRVQVLTRALTTEITNISGTLSAVTGAFEQALIEVVTITDSLLTALLHITKGPPLYLTSKLAKVEGVAKPNRSMERESESYVRKQFEKLFRRIYATGRKYRSG